jgi:predicted transcriptional regulator of viral defense system
MDKEYPLSLLLIDDDTAILMSRKLGIAKILTQSQAEWLRELLAPQKSVITSRAREILNAISGMEQPVTANQVIITTGLPRGTIGSTFSRLKKQGLIEKVEAGRYQLTDAGRKERDG